MRGGGRSRPTDAASSAHRSRNRSGVRVRSLSGRVASDADDRPACGHRRLVDAAGALQVGVDLGACASRSARSCAGAEPDHLPGAVAVRPPPDTQLGGEDAAQLLLIHRPGRLAPPVQERQHPPSHATRRRGARRSGPHNGCEAAGRPARDVRCTNVAAASPPVATRVRTPPVCWRDTAARASRNAERLRHRLHVGPGHDRRDLRVEPNAHSNDTDFGALNVTSNAFTLRRGRPASRSAPSPGSIPFTSAPQLLRLHHPLQAERLGPPARPHPRRLTLTQVVLLDPQRHLTDRVLGVGQLDDRQHQRSSPTRRPNQHAPVAAPQAPNPPPRRGGRCLLHDPLLHGADHLPCHSTARRCSRTRCRDRHRRSDRDHRVEQLPHRHRRRVQTSAAPRCSGDDRPESEPGGGGR